MSLRTQKKRRIKCKTDYQLRMGLLKSKTPRIVIRKTNKYIYAQVVETKEAQDFVKSTISSRDLIKEGWDKKYAGSLKSLPACYLTGLILAKKAGKGKYIIDMGMIRNIKGSRVLAFVKGTIDGGLDINADKSAFPDEKRIMGEHLKPEIKAVINKIKSKLEK